MQKVLSELGSSGWGEKDGLVMEDTDPRAIFLKD